MRDLTRTRLVKCSLLLVMIPLLVLFCALGALGQRCDRQTAVFNAASQNAINFTTPTPLGSIFPYLTQATVEYSILQRLGKNAVQVHVDFSAQRVVNVGYDTLSVQVHVYKSARCSGNTMKSGVQELWVTLEGSQPLHEQLTSVTNLLDVQCGQHIGVIVKFQAPRASTHPNRTFIYVDDPESIETTFFRGACLNLTVCCAALPPPVPSPPSPPPCPSPTTPIPGPTSTPSTPAPFPPTVACSSLNGTCATRCNLDPCRLSCQLQNTTFESITQCGVDVGTCPDTNHVCCLCHSSSRATSTRQLSVGMWALTTFLLGMVLV